MNALTGRNHRPPHEPLRLFDEMDGEAEKHELNDPNAMCLATVDAEGLPNARMVLLKGFDDERLRVLHQRAKAPRGLSWRPHPGAAGVLHWKSLRRQFRLRGRWSTVERRRIGRLFRQPPRDSRIGAWASQQSRPLESRFALEKAVASTPRKFNLGECRARPIGAAIA